MRVSDTLYQRWLFQSGLGNQTFQVEKVCIRSIRYPAAEISEAVTIVKAAVSPTPVSPKSPHEPDKAVWDFALNGTPVNARAPPT